MPQASVVPLGKGERTAHRIREAALERFFRSLRLSLLDKLPGYKGPNIASRGKDVEQGAFYYVTELEQLIREWVGEVYHVKPHHGLRDPRIPGVDLSPQEMFNRGIAVSGLVRLPASEDLRYELMDVEWRMIHHYGVAIDNRRYDGPALNPYRDRRSLYGGAHAGKWPFMVDVDDVRQVPDYLRAGAGVARDGVCRGEITDAFNVNRAYACAVCSGQDGILNSDGILCQITQRNPISRQRFCGRQAGCEARELREGGGGRRRGKVAASIIIAGKVGILMPQELDAVGGNPQMVGHQLRFQQPFFGCKHVFDRTQPGKVDFLFLQGQFHAEVICKSSPCD